MPITTSSSSAKKRPTLSVHFEDEDNSRHMNPSNSSGFSLRGDFDVDFADRVRDVFSSLTLDNVSTSSTHELSDIAMSDISSSSSSSPANPSYVNHNHHSVLAHARVYEDSVHPDDEIG
jgi:hypothetical protein